MPAYQQCSQSVRFWGLADNGLRAFVYSLAFFPSFFPNSTAIKDIEPLGAFGVRECPTAGPCQGAECGARPAQGTEGAEEHLGMWEKSLLVMHVEDFRG